MTHCYWWFMILITWHLQFLFLFCQQQCHNQFILNRGLLFYQVFAAGYKVNIMINYKHNRHQGLFHWLLLYLVYYYPGGTILLDISTGLLKKGNPIQPESLSLGEWHFLSLASIFFIKNMTLFDAYSSSPMLHKDILTQWVSSLLYLVHLY